MYRAVGEFDTTELIMQVQNALDPHQQLPYLKKQFEADNSNLEYCYSYIKALRRGKLDFQEVVGDYFSTQSDEQLLSYLNWKIFVTGVNDFSSRESDYVLNHLKQFTGLIPQEQVEKKIASMAYQALFPLAKAGDTTAYFRNMKYVASTRLFKVDSVIFITDIQLYEKLSNWNAYKLVKTDFGFQGTIYTGSALQSDGKIVVIGLSYNGFNSDFAIARYNTNGSLDNTFDGDGKQTTDFGSSNESAYSIAIQSDGKIVVAGNRNNATNFDIAIARYNKNGRLDSTFDTDGKQTTDFNSANNYCNAVVLQKNGKIVVAGYMDSSGKRDFALARYNSNGSLDNTFDGDGKKTTDLGSADEIAYSLAIQGDGKIIAAGYSGTGNNHYFVIVRYNSDGNLDTSFNKEGKRKADFKSSNDIAYSMALQADGKIVLTGSSAIGFDDDFAVARFNTNGSIDSTFDRDGKQTTDFGLEANTARAVAIQSDGKIIAVGHTFITDSVSTSAYFALARYNKNGSLDSSF